MRVYIPATVDDLPRCADGLWEPPVAYAVTERLLEIVASDDADELAEIARDVAARASVIEAGSPLRVVVVAELTRAECDADPEVHPAAVRVHGRIPASAIACAFVDEPEAAGDVSAAVGGDEDALDVLEERDLLWYDASELGSLKPV
ncbi:DUF6912 family protein [Demequina mangrovi]|uniref:Uncharacterized protein n=1 Tax=Demequina mangrovi TaxID=1043493 RepID=A0A1H6WWN1_9MICO|nr:hypothetical protein [Demequina mangrovi]SEJ21299.1 hypothetical protein SAMN05421637_1174 [Demequina mangrovi]